MIATQQLWFLQQAQVKPVQSIAPALAGVLMLLASVLPWLVDPLGTTYSAWAIAIDVGWQFHTAILSYGLLCSCIALYAFLVAYAQWRPFRGSEVLVQQRTQAGLLCLVPLTLFIMQYLYMDVQGITNLGSHLVQFLLIQQHFGYDVSPMRIVIKPFYLDTSTIEGRFQVLVDQVSFGILVPCISAWLLLDRKRLFMALPRGQQKTGFGSMTRRKRLVVAGVTLLLLVVLGRPAMALFCEYEAKAQLASGNYTLALNWLDAAHFFNPSLEQVAFYHIERGQALYFSYRDQEGDDSRAYLASVYRGQKDYLDAYSQIVTVWHAHRTTPWAVGEMSLTLERLSEYAKPLYGLRLKRIQDNDGAATWVQLLKQVDSGNVYARYMTARIQYERHDYSTCTNEMSAVLRLSNNTDIQSSAYTYIALSDEGLGNYIQSRSDLFKAVALDPNFRNDTAREELSGLR